MAILGHTGNAGSTPEDDNGSPFDEHADQMMIFRNSHLYSHQITNPNDAALAFLNSTANLGITLRISRSGGSRSLADKTALSDAIPIRRVVVPIWANN